jgi:hypothetical protein
MNILPQKYLLREKPLPVVLLRKVAFYHLFIKKQQRSDNAAYAYLSSG